MFSSIDLILRRKWSYIYRAILVAYSVYVYLLAESNTFSITSYLLVCLLYLIFYIIFKKKGYSKLRTTIDFAFIGIILYGKDISLFANYFLLLLPLINSQNNSAKKNNKIGFLLILLLLTILEFKRFNFKIPSFSEINFHLLAPIFVTFLVDSFLRFREKIKKLNEKLFEIIDRFYGVGFNRNKSVNIYSKLIEQLNYFKIIKKLEIEYISCFIIKKREKLILVNSSKPIIEYEFPDENTVINELIKEDNSEGFSIVIDGKTYTNTYFTEVNGQSRKYCFLVIYNKDATSFGINTIFKNMLLSDYILVPAFKHLARLFEIQREVALNRYKSLKEVSSKLDYVLKANEVMHFVKGSLNNIKSSLTLSEMIEKTTTHDEKSFLKESFVKQRKLAKMDIQHIVDRSNFILEKSKNPFEAHNFKKSKSLEILFHIRKKWDERFWNKTVKITGEIEHIFESRINVDFDIVDLILINIFSNIFKYSTGEEQLEFNINFNNIKIIFSNLMEFKSKKSQPELLKLIEYYNKKNRIEISKRKSHGFVHLRTYSEALDISSNMNLVGNRYSVEIEFNFCNDESSDI